MRIPCEGVLALLPQGCPLMAVTQGIPTQHYFCMNHHIPAVTARILYLREWESGEVLAHACVRAESLQSCLTLCDLKDCSPPGSSVHRFSRQEYWSGLSCPSPGDLPNPEIKPRSPSLEADSLPFEPPGNSPGKNTVVGSLSLLQRIFLTQESNWGLLYCRGNFFLPTEL